MFVSYEKKDIVRMIDSTLLTADATEKDVEKLCANAAKYGFAAVIVNPVYVYEAKKYLSKNKSSVKVGTVIGFPLGAELTEIKVRQIKQAICEGADELDAVMPIYAVKQGQYKLLKDEIRALLKACKDKQLKLIIEACLLTEAEIRKVCELCVELRVRYVKTSTGFFGGATKETVSFMQEAIHNAKKMYNVGDSLTEVKASGGIKTYLQAKDLAEAGAKRIGTSAAADIAEFDASGIDRAIKEIRSQEDKLQKEFLQKECKTTAITPGNSGY